MAGRRRADDGPDPGLSERQQRILDFIQAYAERHRVSPSFREIGDAVGLKAISAVKYQVEQLQEKRYLARRDRMPRTIVAKPPRLRSIAPEIDGTPADLGSEDMISMPLFESIAAGTGRGRQSGGSGHHPATPGHGGSGNVFAVQVTGDSMVDATFSMVTAWWSVSRDNAVNGDIVTLCSATGQRSRRFGGLRSHIWLMPENSSYDPILGDGCQIRGKVVATLHRHRSG